MEEGLVFKQIIFDKSALLELWLDRANSRTIQKIIDESENVGVKLWAPAHILVSLEAQTRSGMLDMGESPSQAVKKTRELMENLFLKMDILSSPGYEQKEVYARCKDFETAAVAAAARSLKSDDCMILTMERDFDNLGEIRACSPMDVLDWVKAEDPVEIENTPFVDLARQQGFVRSGIEERIERVLRHGKYILGPETTELEETLAGFVGVRHCLGVSSGTDALLIGLMALGVGPGDEVVTTPFSFIATAEVIALLGAKPIFVDIEPDTFNIDATLLDHALSERTKAVIPVSLYGQCPDFDSINQSVARKQIPVFEDAAQSFGATYKGVKSCALSEIAATSFFPSKPLAGYGEGGALFTNDEELAKSVKEIRAHGEIQRYQHQRLGLNARLDSFQAAILLAKFERLPWEIDRRARIGARYTEMLSGIKGVAAPVIKPDRESVFAQYTIRVNDRESFASALQRLKAPYAIHYPKPLHLQPVFKNFGYSEGDFPVAEKASKEVISLPMHPYLTRGQQEKIVEIIYEAMKSI